MEGWYFIEQMRKFRSGDRGYHPKDEWGRVMATASTDLADWDLKNLIAYVVGEFGLPEATTNKWKPGSGRFPQAFLNLFSVFFA